MVMNSDGILFQCAALPQAKPLNEKVSLLPGFSRLSVERCQDLIYLALDNEIGAISSFRATTAKFQRTQQCWSFMRVYHQNTLIKCLSFIFFFFNFCWRHKHVVRFRDSYLFKLISWRHFFFVGFWPVRLHMELLVFLHLVSRYDQSKCTHTHTHSLSCHLLFLGIGRIQTCIE